jgi:hypothetical protein
VDPQAEWRDLLSAEADPEDAMDVVDAVGDGHDRWLGSGLLGAVENVLDVLIRDDDEALQRRLLEPLAAPADRARRMAPEAPINGGLGAAACATLLAAGGHGDDPAPVLEPWLPFVTENLPRLDDTERTGYALACAALGLDDGLHEVLHQPPMPYVPGATFGPDARSFARHISAAAAASAPLEDFSPAFTSFVAYFPVRLEAGGLSWSDLLFGGYGAFHRIAGYERGEVLDALRRFVREVAEG